MEANSGSLLEAADAPCGTEVKFAGARRDGNFQASDTHYEWLYQGSSSAAAALLPLNDVSTTIIEHCRV